MLSELEPRLRVLPAGHIAFASFASERSLNAQAAGDLPTAMEFADQAVAILEAPGQIGSRRGSITRVRPSCVDPRSSWNWVV